MRFRQATILLSWAGLAACGTSSVERSDTLSQLDSVPADVEDIYVADSLERAAESYRRYLEETDKSARTPEAMRRLADLQIEQAYGVMGTGATGGLVEMAAPEQAEATGAIVAPLSRPEFVVDGDAQPLATVGPVEVQLGLSLGYRFR